MNRLNTIPVLICLILIDCRIIFCQPVFFLPKENNYPRWLKNDNYKTEQITGITFLGLNGENEKIFLLAENTGKINRLTISNDTVFDFTSITFTIDAENYLQKFPKRDFEDIVYDKTTGSIYLSITGWGINYKEYVGIYKLTFSSGVTTSDTVMEITKLNIQPIGTIWKYTGDDIGFKGLAVDSNYFYLGLEGFKTDEKFADSTLIFVVDKKSFRIIKTIDTKALGIHTICGLYSDKDSSLWGIDGNIKKIFHLRFEKNLESYVEKFYNFISRIPNYQNLSYFASIESITFDNEKFMYIVDATFPVVYVPPPEVILKLDKETIKNFKEFIPIIYRYKIYY
jgi:hypothetical protein